MAHRSEPAGKSSRERARFFGIQMHRLLGVMENSPNALDALTLGDEAAQAFVDADTLTRQPSQRKCELSYFLMTRVPLRISEHVRSISFRCCTSLTNAVGLPLGIIATSFFLCSSLASVKGLPDSVKYVRFTECPSLKFCAGLPLGVVAVIFDRCKSLASVDGLPMGVDRAFFHDCTSLTSVAGLPSSVRAVSFSGCSSITKVAGLGSNLIYVDFSSCTSLTSVEGMAASHTTSVYFDGCTALTSVAGLPASLRQVSFRFCTSLTSLAGLPVDIASADFRGCRRLRRFSRRPGLTFGDLTDPVCELRVCMRSGVSESLLEHIGPDVALLVGCFATAGLNQSPQFQDCMETRDQVAMRYLHFSTRFQAKSKRVR